MDRYDRMREFIKENFETTSNKWDRLHTEDVIDLLYRKGGFLYSTGKTAQVFKSMGIGEHKPKCLKISSQAKSNYF
jgi:hypothetical protein